jgi:hypothetical protein
MLSVNRLDRTRHKRSFLLVTETYEFWPPDLPRKRPRIAAHECGGLYGALRLHAERIYRARSLILHLNKLHVCIDRTALMY